MKRLIVRYDDYMGEPPGFREKSTRHAWRWLKERELLALCMRESIPILVGVVPNAKIEPGSAPIYVDSEKCEELTTLRSCGLCYIAQHGTTHAGTADGPTEIFGASEEEAHAALIVGMGQMERAFGEKPKTLIPPWNLIDPSGLRAAKRAGFFCIALGKNGERANDRKLYNEAGIMAADLPMQTPDDVLRRGVVAALEYLCIHTYDIEKGIEAIGKLRGHGDVWITNIDAVCGGA